MEAVLVMVEAQADASAQLMVHSLPAHAMGPAQELPWPQVMVHAVAFEQSTPAWQPDAPQLTWQG